MGTRILLAGATGAVGQRLIPLLLAAGHTVWGTTRVPAKVNALRTLGIEPLVVDVFDAETLIQAVRAAQPEIVIHQLTDLPPGLDPTRMVAAVAANARLRAEGTANLVRAARASGARRMVAQSIAWAYAPGPLPHGESDPLDAAAEDSRGVTVGGVIALERLVLHSPPLDGIVLRYGRLYGPGTGSDAPVGPMPLHVDDAAFAALRAVDHGAAGVYNIAEPTLELATDKARTELGWHPRRF